MRFKAEDFKCPQCGEPAQGTSDMTPACALFTDAETEDGVVDVDYCGESKMYWDGQYTQQNEQGQVALQCEHGHEWFVFDLEEEEADLTASQG